MRKITVSLYLYDEPVLETYWSSLTAGQAFANESIKSREVMAVLIWKGQGKEWPGEEEDPKWEDPDLLLYVRKGFLSPSKDNYHVKAVK